MCHCYFWQTWKKIIRWKCLHVYVNENIYTVYYLALLTVFHLGTVVLLRKKKKSSRLWIDEMLNEKTYSSCTSQGPIKQVVVATMSEFLKRAFIMDKTFYFMIDCKHQLRHLVYVSGKVRFSLWKKAFYFNWEWAWVYFFLLIGAVYV